MAYECACHSTARRLALIYPEQQAATLELQVAAESLGWAHYRELQTLEVPLGGTAKFCGIAELADFVRGIAPGVYPELRATWLAAGDLREQLPALVRAGALTKMVPLPSSPLIGILEERALETWFQPIFTADGLALWGYECLMRAHDGNGRLLGPEQLIGWARQEQLLFTLDRLSRELHVEHAAAAPAPADARFFINFLPTVIYDPQVCLASTIDAVRRVGLAPERIVFEVVETELVSDRRLLRRIVDHYRQRGFRVALDDLGAGHSDLVLLGDLAPDLIKIERELIARSVDSSIHRAICRSIADIGRSEKKMVLAEGVQTPQEWAFINGLGVDLVQGFLFGEPAHQPALRPKTAGGS
jgi:EAL domain-containing protein (putative c-di-GMP-specific phosphodiesterase class I)